MPKAINHSHRAKAPVLPEDFWLTSKEKKALLAKKNANQPKSEPKGEQPLERDQGEHNGKLEQSDA
jgi:hypothetical protein